MNYLHAAHDFTVIIHLCVISCALLLGSFLRSKVKFLQKYLIPAPMLAGLLLFLFYNFAAEPLGLGSGSDFMEELIFHLLNISFIAMQLRIPEEKTKVQKKLVLSQNVTALLAEYGLQIFLGLIVAATILKNLLPGSSVALGETLCLGFELGPGQAESVSSVWEGAPYNVSNAGDVGLIMAAIGFLVGSVGGVLFINLAAKKKWIAPEYVEKLRNRQTGNGFFRNRADQPIGGRQTTANDSMDTMTLHLALVLFTYMISYLLLAGLEKLVIVTVGQDSKIFEVVNGMWGINFVFSSLVALVVRKVIIACKAEHIIDNHTCNRIDGIAVDFTIAACLGAITLSAIRQYWVVVLVLSGVGILITCVLTPWFCSRLFSNYSFFRFLMIFGTAAGTLPTALSLIRVVDPDFETPVAQDYVNSTGIMFVFALPLIAFMNWPAQGKLVGMLILSGAYIVAAFISYLRLARKKAFAGGALFYTK